MSHASLAAKNLAVTGGALEIPGAKAVVLSSGDNYGAAAVTVDGASLIINGEDALDAGKGGESPPLKVGTSASQSRWPLFVTGRGCAPMAGKRQGKKI